MPEVKRAFESCWFDTAATQLPHFADVFRTALALVGEDQILFGSAFPLVPQETARREVEAALGDGAAARSVLGGNAARLPRIK